MLSYSCVWLRSDIYVATQTEVSWDKVGKRSVDAWISCNDYGDIAIEAHLLVRFGEAQTHCVQTNVKSQHIMDPRSAVTID